MLRDKSISHISRNMSIHYCIDHGMSLPLLKEILPLKDTKAYSYLLMAYDRGIPEYTLRSLAKYNAEIIYGYMKGYIYGFSKKNLDRLLLIDVPTGCDNIEDALTDSVDTYISAVKNNMSPDKLDILVSLNNPKLMKEYLICDKMKLLKYIENYIDITPSLNSDDLTKFRLFFMKATQYQKSLLSKIPLNKIFLYCHGIAKYAIQDSITCIFLRSFCVSYPIVDMFGDMCIEGSISNTFINLVPKYFTGVSPSLLYMRMEIFHYSYLNGFSIDRIKKLLDRASYKDLDIAEHVPTNISLDEFNAIFESEFNDIPTIMSIYNNQHPIRGEQFIDLLKNTEPETLYLFCIYHCQGYHKLACKILKMPDSLKEDIYQKVLNIEIENSRLTSILNHDDSKHIRSIDTLLVDRHRSFSDKNTARRLKTYGVDPDTIAEAMNKYHCALHYGRFVH